MSATLFDLSAILRLNSSEFDLGLMAAEAKANGFSGVLKTMVSVGKKAFTAISVASTAFAATSVRTGAVFDKSMSQVAATMGLTMDEMANEIGTVDLAWGTFSGNLRDYAMEMGEHTAFSAKQAADALNYMALAGYKTQESMEMLPNVLNLAAAGNMDLARASDMVTDTQTAFGITFERTSQMVDEMAKAASTGNTSVEQLGNAFLVVGGIAKELNGGFVTLSDGTQESVDGLQEMEIALTAMANAGVKGSEAGTHMRNMLMKLSSPTAEGTKQLEALGVSVFDAEGQMRSLSDIFSDLSVSLGDLTQEEKLNAISDLFNARDLASASALLSAVNQDWDAIGESILDAEGAAQKMADTQLDNLAGDVTLFKSALEGAQIALSDRLAPALRNIVQAGTEGMGALTEIFKGGGSNIADLISGMLDNIANSLNSTSGTMVSIGLATAQIFIQGFVDGAGQIGDSFGNVISSAFELVTSNSDRFLKYGMNIITSVVEGFEGGLTSFTEAGASMLTSLGKGLVAGVPTFLENVLPLIEGFTANLRENAGTIVDAGIDFVLNLAQGIINSLPLLLEQLPQIVINIAGVINDNAPKLLIAGITLIKNIIMGIVQSIPALIENFPQIFKAILSVWTALNWVSIGKNAIKFITSGVRSLATSIPNALKSIGNNALEWFKAIDWRTLGADIIDLIKIGVESLKTAIPEALKAIGHTAMEYFKSIDWGSVGSAVISGIVSGISNGAHLIADAARGAARKAFQAAKNFLGIKSPSKLFRDQIGMNIGKGLALGIRDTIPVVTDAIDDMSDELSDFDDLGYNASVVTSANSGARNSSEDVAGLLKELIGAIADLDDGLYDKFTGAFEAMSFSINGREFGRMVRDVRTA